MARTGGDKTRKRILAVAEKLFSARGFDATSVSEIARAAGVNKALIYYHFKNKNDLILRLFESIVEEVSAHVEQQTRTDTSESDGSLRQGIQDEVEFLAGRKRILSVMLTEAFRSSQRDEFLFRCAELAIQREHAGEVADKGTDRRKTLSKAQLLHEFFTGFMPLVAFVALRDKWCKHYDCAPEQVTADFIDAFAGTHVRSQTKRG